MVNITEGLSKLDELREQQREVKSWAIPAVAPPAEIPLICLPFFFFQKKKGAPQCAPLLYCACRVCCV